MSRSEGEGPAPVVERNELLIPGPATGLAGVLDVDAPVRFSGDRLPPGWHWVYLLDRYREDELGPDGHALLGVPAPPGPGRLRMFAGGRLLTLDELRMGEVASRVTHMISTTEKRGRSGLLTFVTTRSELRQGGQLAVVEEQDLVYRVPGSDHRQSEAPVSSPAPELEDEPLVFQVDPVLLFRFSALTYNAHRIHYDLDYARQEGYPNLVVHGPLQALLMMERLRRQGVSLVGRQFAYRLLAPTFGPQRLSATHRLSPDGPQVSVYDERGVQTASGWVDDEQMHRGW